MPSNTRTELKISIDNVDEVITGVVSSFGNGAKIDIPKRYHNRRVKILILREKENVFRGFRMDKQR